MGARMRTPATSVSKARSYSPSKWLTSVDESRGASGLRHADHAAGRARQDGVLAVEQIRGREPAGRHHEHEPRTGALAVEFVCDLRHVAGDDRREIGVDHGGVAAADELDQRRNLVARGYLREAERAGERGNALFVRRITIGVQEHDRDRGDAVGLRAFERGAGFGEIRLAFDRAVGAHALADLDDALVENLGLDDVSGKNLGPRLIADFQRVAEPPGGDEQRALALALEQRVGRNRGAHLDRADAALRDRRARLEPEQIANALDRGVAIGLRIFREQLVGAERAVRPQADHVGERAAAVDPELPGLLLGSGHPPSLGHLLRVPQSVPTAPNRRTDLRVVP